MSSVAEALTATLLTLTPVVAINLPMTPAKVYTVNYTNENNSTESFTLIATSWRHAINSTLELNPGIKQIDFVEIAPEF